MLSIILVGLVIIICVFPVMITAKKISMGKHDLVDCIYSCCDEMSTERDI